MKNILLLMGIVLLSLVIAARAADVPPMIQFRLVVDNPTADSEPMTIVQSGRSPYPPEVLNVQKEVLLDNSVVKSAMVYSGNKTGGKTVIYLNFTDDGSKRFAEVTRQSVGKRLAIVIDGKLYMAPQINSAITGGEAQITGAFTKAEADNLAARLNGSNGSPSGQARPGNQTVFFALAAMVIVALVTAAWVRFVKDARLLPPDNAGDAPIHRATIFSARLQSPPP